jgi:hypothetical protein
MTNLSVKYRVKTEQNNKEAALRIEKIRKIFRKTPELYKERLERLEQVIFLDDLTIPHVLVCR